jgi:hypothetical protein
MVPNYWRIRKISAWQAGNKSVRRVLTKGSPIKDKGSIPMAQPAEDMIVQNLIEALGRLHEDLDRMELWAAALGSFQHPVPDYQPGEQQLLQPSKWPSPKRM